MASSYEIKNGRLIFRNNGEEYIDDAEKKHISGSFTEIEFPSCFNELYDDDFKACRNLLANVTKLDFTKATKIETIGDDTFTGASSLKVVVLPKKVTAINEFKKCPNLQEIHIYKLEDLYSITKDEDKRLTVYASQVSSDIDSLDEGFLSDVGILYVPANKVRQMEKARDDYDDELDIRPLPDGYSFPTEALSEPWQEAGNNHSSEAKHQPVLSGFNPFNKGEEKYKYIVQVNEAGDDKDAVTKVVMEICNCTKQKAKEFVDELDDLLHDDEICSVESESTAKNIKQKLVNAGADVSIRKCEYEIRIDKVTQKLQTVKTVQIILNCGIKEAKDLVDSVDEDNLLGTEIKTVDTLEEARSIKAQLEEVGAKVSISTSSSVIDEDDDFVSQILKKAGIDNLSEKEIDDLFKSDDDDEETTSFDLDQVYGGPQYHCVLEGKSFGPVTIRQFANMVRFGIVDKNTMVWKEGMSNWALAQTVADLQSVL